MNWIDIPEWDRYQVSEKGDVRSKDMVVNAKGEKTAVRKGRLLTLITKNNGYLCVTLTNGVDRPQIGVHRLVARAFIGECPIGLQVLHWDGDKTNNCPTNLRYGTQAENKEDDRRLRREGRILDREAVNEIRGKKDTATALAKKFGVSLHTIHGVWYRRSWKHV